MSDSPTIKQRLHQRRLRHRQRSKLYRGLFGVSGMLITLAGLIMLVVPGPAIVVIPIGLSMLALEFTWAERLLEKMLERAEQAKRSSRRFSRRNKTIATIITGALFVGGGMAVYVFRDEVFSLLNR